jgi:hypothetical protein
MTDRIPRSQGDHVLVDVKAKPSGWPTASLDPDSGRGPMARSGTPAPREIHKFRSLRFTGIAGRAGRGPMIWSVGLAGSGCPFLSSPRSL